MFVTPASDVFVSGWRSRDWASAVVRGALCHLSGCDAGRLACCHAGRVFFGTPLLSARGPFWRFCGRDACCVAGRVVVSVPDVQPLLRSSPERQGRWSTTLCQSVPGPAWHQPGGLTSELVDPRHANGCLCVLIVLRIR